MYLITGLADMVTTIRLGIELLLQAEQLLAEVVRGVDVYTHYESKGDNEHGTSTD